MLTAELNKTRKIGIEIEAVVADISGASRFQVQQRIADIFSANGLPSVARDYTHEPVPEGKVLCVEYDSSLVGNHEGWNGLTFHQLEIKTKPLNGLTEYLAVIPKMVKLASFLNLQVNKSCGLHVHLDTSEEVQNPTFIKSLLNLTYRFEPVIYGLVPPSRKNCGYCTPLPDFRESWSRCRNRLSYQRLLGGWTRYTGVNMTHILSDNSRIEFRHASSSLDHEKITSWVVFLNRLMDAANTRNAQTPREQVENNRAGLQKMLVTLGLLTNTRVWTVSKDLSPYRRYIIRRWKQLNTDQLKRRAPPPPGRRRQPAGLTVVFVAGTHPTHARLRRHCSDRRTNTFGSSNKGDGMCGIAGFVGQSREGQWGETYSILRELFVASEHRGRDATGFAALTEPMDVPNRQSVIVGKQPITASKYVKTDSDWNGLARRRCSMVIQHVRAATHGSPADPKNNHPFASDDGLFLVHNGVVGNDADLCDQFSIRRRKSECDSEVLLLIVEQAKHPAEGLATCLREVRGSMSVAVMDSRRNVVYLATNGGRPLWVCRLRDERRIFFASTAAILLSAMDRVLGRRRDWIGWMLPLSSGHVHALATDGRLLALTTQPARYLAID